ncbi:DUF397 domain-containing protein [Nocardia huaxiensis]|uniref:DUF397 domain-containing protein n=1 Tax=Nocardia huaxiensis TaxID=2755382 RepID=UPI001E4371B8|nr:DUF397 domain-containing protein [Nocardia huaxiensis]UFS98391.1 DUF397 domain-containing protein [Nocardia huaxiensis]
MSKNPPSRTWYKSSRSETSKQCVEICHDADRVGVRDSKDRGSGPELWFPVEAWDSFLASGVWRR